MIIKAVDMTKAVMEDLEAKNFIIRLAPDSHREPVEEGDSKGQTIYSSDIAYGGHKLISVIINRDEFSAFGIHKDNEEFLLIGSNEDKTLHLLISYLGETELREKIEDGSVSSDDFICLNCRFNDPEVSFFTMLKGVPHGEKSVRGKGTPSKFYVTEPTDLASVPIDISGLNITVI